MQASHAHVFKSMDVVVCEHAIPSIGTLIQVKTKAQVRLELDLYFKELMFIATSPDFPIKVDIMHKYVASMAALKTTMCILSDELDKGSQEVYLDDMEVRVRFQKDVTLEHTDTIMDY